jgi:predicted AlkP superfamily pyrophosphatase or phosphodiesterase
MKKLIVAIILLFSHMLIFSQKVKHVVIVTIDGFRPDFYLDSTWHTPHIKQLMKQGVYAYGVNSVLPSMTYPSHTTIVTGVQPATHGVYYNNMFNPAGGKGMLYWKYSTIKVPTLWSVLHQQGKTVASICWPMTGGAPVDYNIPDNADLGDSMQYAYSIPKGFIDTVKHQIFNQTEPIEFGKDQNVARIAAYVIEKAKPTLTTVHFFSVDHAEHTVGRTGAMVEQAIADADSGVAIIQQAIRQSNMASNTVLIVTGDHGFKNVTTVVSPNVWLKENNIITDSANWKAIFNSVGGATFLYLKDKSDKETLNKVLSILQNQPDSIKKYYRIITRDQMDAIGGNPEVAFCISGENGSAFSNASHGNAVKPGKGGTHGFFPDTREIQTGFIACGPGLQTGGKTIHEMNLRDIAPLVASLLNISFPTAEGKIPQGVLAK